MALNLKNQEVDRLAAEVAALAKESKTEAVRNYRRKARLSPFLVRGSAAAGSGMLREFHTRCRRIYGASG
jgi:hypothetical protein